MWAHYLDQIAGVLHILRHEKGRSFLTLLGMIFGAGSVVLLAGLLSGGEEALQQSSQDATGADMVRVDPAPAPQGQRARTQRSLDRADQEAIGASTALGLRTAEGVVQAWGATARYRDDKMQVMLFGTSEQGLDLYRLGMARGRFLDEEDLRRRNRVCVVGQQVWQTLLGAAADLSPLAVQVDGVLYQVIGVLQHKVSLGGEARRGETWDGRVIVPVTTVQTVVRRSTKVDRLFLRLSQKGVHLSALLDPARQMTRTLLLRRHDGIENFKVDQDHDSRQQEEAIFLVIHMLMLCTAGLSLIVGGINIMNIMLVTVTERTREIGVRRALGATRGDILRQFLLESAIIGGVGGMAGVGSGVVLVFGSSRALSAWLGYWPAHYEGWAMALGLVSATSTGLLFGLYPAWRAAHLHPVDALRYE